MPARIDPPFLPDLAAHLSRNGISRRSLAERIGIDPQTLTHVISGRVRATPKLRIAVAEALGENEATLFAPSILADQIGELTPEQIARTRTFIESCLRRKLRRTERDRVDSR